MKRRTIIIIVAAVVISALAIWFIMSRVTAGWVELSVPDQVNTTVAVTIEKSDGSIDSEMTLEAGDTTKVRLETGTYRVDASTNTSKSVDVIDVKGSATVKLSVPSGVQRSIAQIGSDATYCPLIVRDVLYSYDCNGRGPVFRHNPTALGSSTKAVLFGGGTFDSFQPLKEGLVGVVSHADHGYILQFADLPSESIQTIELPETIRNLMQSDVPEIVVSSAPGESRFAMIFPMVNKVFLFTDTTASPIEIQLQNNVALNIPGRQTAGSFSGDHFFLFVGNVTDIHAEATTPFRPSDESEETPEKQPVYLFEYDAAGKPVDTIELPKETVADNFYKLTDNYYAAQLIGGFTFYYEQGEALEEIYTLEDVSSWVIIKEKLYVQAAGTLYEFKPAGEGMFGLHGLYSSANRTVSELFDSPKGLIFTAFVGDSADAPLNVFQLLETVGQDQPGAVAEPVYENFYDLTQYGIAATQVSNLTYALSQYVQTLAKPPATIAVSSIVPVPHNRYSTSTVDTITFVVKLDNKDTFNARMDYSELTKIRVYLSDPKNNQQVYDSGDVNRTE